MRPLSEISTTLFLGLTLKHLKVDAELADAAAIIAGRTQKWTTWRELSKADQLVIAQSLRLRPKAMAQPSLFLEQASDLLNGDFYPFEFVSEPSIKGASLTDRYRLRDGMDLDQVIRENFEELKYWRVNATSVTLPDSGDIELTYTSADRVRTFTIGEADRHLLPPADQRIRLHPAEEVQTISWSFNTLKDLAVQLDDSGVLHRKHLTSLSNLWQKAGEKSGNAGEFYRVNAPTGSGKSVLMVMMAIDAARRGQRVVIGVPSLVEVDNFVKTLQASAAVAAPSLKIARLHSIARIQERGLSHFQQHSGDHPYDYPCLLNTFASDLQSMPADQEPCFQLSLVMPSSGKEQESKRLSHCPFLFKCGKTRMFEEALEADITVVNHHALLSSTTRIPLEDSEQYPGPRSYIEILLRSAPIFLIDEIDGLLKTAIDNSTFELELGNLAEHSALIKFHMSLAGRSRVPGVSRSDLIRIKWPLNYCANGVDQLMDLQARKYFEWPKGETTWATAYDRFVMGILNISFDELQRLYDAEDLNVPVHLKGLRANLVHWSRGTPSRRPESLAVELGLIINELFEQGHLVPIADAKARERLKAALILRGVLEFIEQALRDLQSALPSFASAELPYAYEVQQRLRGSEPSSLTPFGPLHRTVFGFKRKQATESEATLNVVAMRGDPHSTLLALPEIMALGYAGVERFFLGFSATAYFPGASAYDLKAKDFIDVPDAKGQVTFQNIPTTTAVSGSHYFERSNRVKELATEIWPWVTQRLERLAQDPHTAQRARLLLVANSDADAERLALTLADLSKEPIVGWVRGRSSQYKPSLLSEEHKLIYDDLAEFTRGAHKDKRILVSALQPMARGHNIVNDDGLSAIGAVVICVRPLPASDAPENNLAHVCYETLNSIAPCESPSSLLKQEMRLSNSILHSIRTAYPAFSEQPENVRHYTVMNILVTLTQLIGRGRRGGTPITCYFADAAFTKAQLSWAKLLQDSMDRLKRDGDWEQFSLHHAGIASAVEHYIDQSRQKEVGR